MANEFVARNGLIAQANSQITGSLIVSNGITANLTGTASYASNANLLDGLDSTQFTLTSSFNAYTASVNNNSGSFVTYTNFNADTASINAFSASILSYTGSLNAATSSFVLNSQTGAFATFTVLNAYTSSTDAHTASINLFTASINTYTASNNTTNTTQNNRLTGLENYTQSLNSATGAFATFTALNAYTSSTNAFSASILSYTASVNNFITGINSYTSSLNSTTSSFVRNSQTSSFVQNSQTGSFATFTALNAYTSSLNSYTQSLNSATSSFVRNSQTSSMSVLSASYAQTSSFASNFIVANTLTAQTLVVQTVTSSVIYSSGSNRFGNDLTNTQVLTGSVIVTGSLSVNGRPAIINDNIFPGTAGRVPRFITTSSIGDSNIYTAADEIIGLMTGVGGSPNGAPTPHIFFVSGSSYFSGATTTSGSVNITGSLTVSEGSVVEFQVLPAGVQIGGHVSDIHNVTGSLIVSGSLISLNGSNVVLTNQTGAFVPNSQTSSFVLNSQTSSMSVLSASFASTASTVNLITIPGAGQYAIPFTGISGDGTGSQQLYVTGSDFSFLPQTQTLNVKNLFGTASFALTSSYANNANLLDGLDSTAFVLNSQTSSFVQNSQTSSFATFTALNSYTSSINSYTSSLNSATSSFVRNSQTSSFVQNSQTSSFVLNSQTSSFVQNSQTGAFATFTALNAYTSSTNAFSASINTFTSSVNNFITGINSYTSSLNSATSSFVRNSQTSSMSVLSASFAATASRVNILTGSGNLGASQYSIPFVGTNQDTPGAQQLYITGSDLSYEPQIYTLNVRNLNGTASYASNANLLDGLDSSAFTLNSQTSSFVQNSQTSSFVLNSQTSSFVQNSQTGAFATFTALNAYTSSINSYTSSLNSRTSSFATTGSNTFLGNQTISGSLTVFTGSGVEFQVTNTGTKIGNALSDNHTVTGSLLLSGSLTSTGTLTAQTLIVQTITSSVIFSSGSNTFGNSLANTQVLTGSVIVTGSLSVNGSNTVLVNQTSSFVQNSQTSSFVLNSQTSSMSVLSASFAVTASTVNIIPNPGAGQYAIIFSGLSGGFTGSQQLALTGSDFSYEPQARRLNVGSISGTASYANNADTLDGAHLSQLATTGSNSFKADQTISGSVTLFGPNNNGYNIRTQNSSLILEGNAGLFSSFGSQLRITANPGAWTDNVTSSYFQIKTTGSFGSNNYVTFQGGTWAADAPFDRLQFASYYTSFNNGAYGTTPVPTASFEIINSNSGTIPLLQLKTLVGQTSNYVNITSGSTAGNVFNITKDGVVAIGTTNTSTEGNLFLGAKGTDEGGQLFLQKGTTQASASMIDNYQNTLRVLTGTDTTSVRMDLELSHVTQNLRIFGDVIAFAASDKRLKENIQPIPNALDKLNQIGGYTFDWKTEGDLLSLHGHEGRDIGVIAQEIESILPEVVTTRDNGYKAVKYEKIVPLLIQAIKEQQEQIKELQDIIKNK